MKRIVSSPLFLKSTSRRVYAPSGCGSRTQEATKNTKKTKNTTKITKYYSKEDFAFFVIRAGAVLRR